MTTIKDLSLEWWSKLDWNTTKNMMMDYYPDRHPRDLIGREIEDIFFEEIIVKWWDSVEDKFTMLTKYSLNSGLKEIYLKEHTKEEQLEKERGIVIVQNGKPYQPKEEVDVWDEVERILYNHDQPIGNKIAMLKAKFTLIKKQ